MYIPYADTTILRVDFELQFGIAISAHWAWTALYNGSPVRFAMYAPDAKSVVAHISFMSPPASSVPAVDSALDLVLFNTVDILFNCWAD